MPEAARSAMRPTPQQAVEMLVGAKVSWHFASQTRQRPRSQGMIEIPSGSLPSPLQRPQGSRVQGMSTATKARLMMSLRQACLGSLPWILRQLKAWIPVSSTLAPHWAQSCGRQRAELRRSPTAIRILALSICRPRADKGEALSLVLDSFCWEAKRRALAMGFALVVRLAARARTTGLSQAF